MKVLIFFIRRYWKRCLLRLRAELWRDHSTWMGRRRLLSNCVPKQGIEAAGWERIREQLRAQCSQLQPDVLAGRGSCAGCSGTVNVIARFHAKWIFSSTATDTSAHRAATNILTPAGCHWDLSRRKKNFNYFPALLQTDRCMRNSRITPLLVSPFFNLPAARFLRAMLYSLF